MAIDMPDLVAAVFQGGGTPAAALVPPALWGHDASLQPYGYDPEAAKQLLAEAGYPNGFSTELWAIPVVRPYMPNGRRAAEMIQADWAKIGVKARILTYEWGEYLKRRVTATRLWACWARSGIIPTRARSCWASCATRRPMRRTIAAMCTTRRCGRRTWSPTGERAQLYEQAQQAMYDDVPLVRLANVKAYVPVRKNVEGFKLHFLGGQPFGGVSLGK